MRIGLICEAYYSTSTRERFEATSGCVPERIRIDYTPSRNLDALLEFAQTQTSNLTTWKSKVAHFGIIANPHKSRLLPQRFAARQSNVAVGAW